MTDIKYNGWTNHATWRVNLEMFDGMNGSHFGGAWNDEHDLARLLKDYAEDAIIDSSQEGWTREWAIAFIGDVNWVEIAEHLIEE